MKYSDITKLKHLAQDKISRSANPAVVRNSTIFFKSMQEFLEKEKLVKKGLKVNFHDYGRSGSQTTIALQDFIAELELAHATFLTSTGFSAVALAIMSICRPGDEIVVTNAVYAPTRMITSKLLKQLNPNEQYMHATTNIPWPIKDRDIVMHSKKTIQPNGIVTYTLNWHLIENRACIS